MAEQAEVEEAVRESNPDEFSQHDTNVSRFSLMSEANLNVSQSELMPRGKKIKKKKKKVYAPKPVVTQQEGELPPIGEGKNLQMPENGQPPIDE